MAHMFTGHPPFIRHSENPISTENAASFLTAFLQHSNIDPSYRPDSTLSEGGPQSTSTAANPSLVLYELQRVKKGLEGKVVRGDFSTRTWGKRGTEGEGDGERVGKKTKKTGQERVRDGGRKSKAQDAAAIAAASAVTPAVADEDWQDKEDFELEQEVEEGDAGDRGQNDVPIEPEELADVGMGNSRAERPKTKAEKEERKRRKKERGKDERRQKNKKGAT